MRKIAIHLLLSICLYITGLYFISSLVFFSSDSGLRYLQIKQLQVNHWQTYAIDYPGIVIDPDLEMVPYYYAYSIINNAIYLNITPFFPLLSSIFDHVLGLMGLALVPVISGIMIGWGIYKLSVINQLPYPNAMFWASIIATPVLFYSVQLWDHSLGVALAVWAVYFVDRGMKESHNRSIIVGGFLMGIGLGQRPELYAFAIALGLCVVGITNFKQLKSILFIFGGGIGVLPVWLFQYLTVGHPLGIIIANSFFEYGVPDEHPFPGEFRQNLPRTQVIGHFLYQINKEQPVLTVISLILILFGMYYLFISLRKTYQKNMFLLGTILLIFGYSICFIISFGNAIQGFISTFPLIGFAIAFIPGKNISNDMLWKTYKFISLLVGMFFVIMLMLWPADGGFQWGARYLLPAYPLLLIMASFVYREHIRAISHKQHRTFKLGVISMLIMSVIMQIGGLIALDQRFSEQKNIRESVVNLPVEFILTNAPYFQSEMASTDKVFVFVGSIEKLTQAIMRLAEMKVFNFAFIPLEAIQLEVPGRISGFRIDMTSNFVYQLLPE
jgi:hypothetical protein